jgi:hypothetical protein
MKLPLVICGAAVVMGTVMPEARANGLAVDTGVGYRSWSRGDASLSRSFVQVTPAYSSGRWRVAAPVAVAFRSSEGPFSFGNPLAFKSDDWVNLDVEASYTSGRTRVTFQHDSLQLLSSGRMPSQGFGDVETDNRLFAYRGLGRVGGSRLQGVAGYWGMDRWTETQHGQWRGPVLGFAVTPEGEGLAPLGQLLVGRESSGQFTSGQLGVRMRRATWQIESTFEVRRYPSGTGALFARDESRLNLVLVKSFR